MPKRDFDDFIQRHPHPGDDPGARLRHTLDVYADRADDTFLAEASRNLYGQGEVTGLTWGDLRAIAAQIGV